MHPLQGCRGNACIAITGALGRSVQEQLCQRTEQCTGRLEHHHSHSLLTFGWGTLCLQQDRKAAAARALQRQVARGLPAQQSLQGPPGWRAAVAGRRQRGCRGWQHENPRRRPRYWAGGT